MTLGGHTFLFLIPLVLGFSFNLASAFTTAFSHRWGERGGSILTVVLRDVLGIPVWAIGFGLAALTPSPVLFAPVVATQVLEWLLIGAGGVIILAALITIRVRSVRPSATDVLAQDGLYAHVRHPIHSGTLLEFFGLFIIKPTQVIALACALGIIWVLIQTRLEEQDLLQRLPAYREYMQRVPRFVPRFWG
jgi:protein-S-isoprenylcysteine O-methyltransferase Ste14